MKKQHHIVMTMVVIMLMAVCFLCIAANYRSLAVAAWVTGVLVHLCKPTVYE